MKIIINTKKRFNIFELKEYINHLKGSSFAICVPYDCVLNLDYDNLYTQNFSDLVDFKNNILGSLIGHSSVKESFDILNNKIVKLIKKDLKAIVCIGENEITNNVKEVLYYQLDNLFVNVDVNDLITIAYEPVWAIGGNIKFDINYIVSNIKYIKSYFLDKYKKNISIVYGGSVNLDLINELNSFNLLDGYLISSYALDISNLERMKNLLKI